MSDAKPDDFPYADPPGDPEPCPYCGTAVDGADNEVSTGSRHYAQKCREYVKAALIGTQRDLDATRAELERTRAWGVYVVTGPSAGTWCCHVTGMRIATDERTAKTVALMFTERFDHQFQYEAREFAAIREAQAMLKEKGE
jgi:hypothetical protein